jgi:hypothetical protein
MPELLEGLAQLARERGHSLQRASRELTGEPEGFLIVTREVCKFVGLLSDIWATQRGRLGRGGVPAKRLLQECDLLLDVGQAPAHYLGLAVKVWHERGLPAELADPVLADVEAARGQLSALLDEVRKAREQAAAPPRISADPEGLARRIQQADEGREWVRLADAVSGMWKGGPPQEE